MLHDKSINLHLHTFATKNEVIAQSAKSLNTSLKEASLGNKDCLLLLSGGSALELLEQVNDNYLSSKVTIGVLDERFSPDPQINNMAQLQQTSFYNWAIKKGCQTIDTTVSSEETIEQLASRFQQALSAWKKHHPSGIIVATMGMGPDGHTSGIMPFPESPTLFSQLFEQPEKLVVGYDADGKNPFRYRVTTTNTFLRGFIDQAVVYVTGENKREAMGRLTSKSGSIATTPARILREMKRVDLFTDLGIE